MIPRSSFARLVSGLMILAAGALCTVVAQPAGRGNGRGGQEVTLNLKDADISTLIATVSEVTGKNFIVDPRVKAKVTVVSSTPMDAAGVYETFLAVLQVNGFAAIPAGQSIKITLEANARSDGGGYVGNGVGLPLDDIVTHVISLESASATQLVANLRPLVAQSGQLAAYAPNNSLIISDRASNVVRMEKLIRQIDSTGDRDVEMVPLENASAAEVVRVLTTLAQQSKQADPSSQQTAVIADERNNAVLLAGDKGERVKLVAVIKQLDSPSKNAGDTQVVYLNYASAENLAPILEGYAQQQSKPKSGGAAGSPAPATPSASSASGGGSGDLRVLADKDTNALVITAPPKIMQQIKNVIAQLDIRRSQVLVQGIIAEVSQNKSSELGVDYVAYDPNSIAATGILNSSTLSALQNASSALATTTTSNISTSSAIAAGVGLIGSGATAVVGSFSNGRLFGALLKALQSDGDTNILSTPSLTTLDNEEAKFSVGQEVPFQTGSYSNTGTTSNGAVNPFQTIDRKDVGLTLGITPTISQGNTLKLKIDLENSSIASGVAGSSSLITNKRKLSNTVSVDSGQILVIGGLIDDQFTDTQNRIPLLSDIPILGSLFRSRSITKTKQNLMIFVHPVILRSREQGDFYTRRKYDEIRETEVHAATGAIPLVGGQRPILYHYEDYIRENQAPQSTMAPPPGVAPGTAVPPKAVTTPASSFNTAPSPSATLPPDALPAAGSRDGDTPPAP